MSLDKLNAALVADVAALKEEGRAKAPERIIVGYVPAAGTRGPALSAARQRPRLPADEQQQLPVAVASPGRCWPRPTRRRTRLAPGPGAVRFIDGTFAPACAARGADRAVRRPAGGADRSTRPTRRSSAWRSRSRGPDTFWIGDELNHNCIIRAMRIANVPSAQRAIYKHNDLADLAQHLERVPDGTRPRRRHLRRHLQHARRQRAGRRDRGARRAGTSTVSATASSR